MNKIKTFFKRNLKNIMAFVIGITLSGTIGVVAYDFYANTVSYDNTQSGLTSTNVQEAIDELNNKTTDCQNIKDNTIYYDIEKPTTSSTTDYTTLNKEIFIAKNGEQESLCIIRNNELYCFDNNNYAIEKEHVKQVFSSDPEYSCTESSYGTSCNKVAGLNCEISSSGEVRCNYTGPFYGCRLATNNYAFCSFPSG